MANKFAVQMRLSDSDHAAFNAFLTSRRTTLDAAVNWMKSRGYRISRGAVWKYKRMLLECRGLELWRGQSRAISKRLVLRQAELLGASSLALLAAFASFLASGEAGSGGGKGGQLGDRSKPE